METAPLLEQRYQAQTGMHQLARTAHRGRYTRIQPQTEAICAETRATDHRSTDAMENAGALSDETLPRRSAAGAALNGTTKGVDGCGFGGGDSDSCRKLVRNPFARRDRTFRVGTLVRLVFGLIVLLPIRLLLSVGCLVFAWILVFLVTLGVSRASLAAHPLPRWRRRIVFGVLRFFSRFLLLVYGFWRVREFGDLGSRQNLSSGTLIVSNHVSFFDILYFIYAFAPAFVAKKEVLRLPFVGTIAAAMQSIFVDRERSRTGGTAELIRMRLTSADANAYPPLVLFPEGTTSNGDALLRFHSGAFLSGVPVRPLALRYGFWDFDPAFVGLTPWRLACILAQPWMSLTVHHLPLYEPSPTEMERPRLYAENIRALIARALQVECVDMGYRDRVQRNLSRIGLHMVEVIPVERATERRDPEVAAEDDALRSALV
jgi:lysophosphatidylcholine acyltransferase/lyso-PAF acetyltransferase